MLEKPLIKEVIYIHPYTPFIYPWQNIPLSLPALINRLPFKINGFFAEELNKSTIKNAKIAIIDIHWFISLYGAYILCKKLKKTNKEIIIIAGGLTASEFSGLLIKNFNIDFIIRGDGEIPLTMLVNKLLNDHNVSDVPNIIGKNDFFTEQKYFLTQKDIDDNDYLNIDFFPSFKQVVYNLHKFMNLGSPIFPFIVISRGCPFNCKYCAGSVSDQKKLFKRGCLIRSPNKVVDDIRRIEANKNFSFIRILHDFLTIGNDDYVNEILGNNKFKLKLGIELFSTPKTEQLKHLMDCFDGGTITFPMDNNHSTTDILTNIETLIQSILLVQRNPNYHPILYYNKTFAISNKIYHSAVDEIYKKTNCKVLDMSWWWVDYPIPDDNGYSENSTFGSFFKASYNQERIFNKDKNDLKPPYRYRISKSLYLLRNYKNINSIVKKLI